MGNTLLLDRKNWDLCIDAAGNIAVASEPYSIVQDVASACRLFTNELWYGGDRGIPYFEQILGAVRPFGILKEKLRQQALSVPGVLSAVVYITDAGNRTIGGQVQITTSTGSHVVTL